jgi:nucleotide-binding universal stress UspA family protein
VLELPQENEPLATLPFDMSTYRAAVEEDATRRLVDLVSDDIRAACQPATRLVHGKPYEQILAVAKEMRSDLIVLGVHGRKAFDMMIFGSTTNQVVRRATCPVLTLNR